MDLRPLAHSFGVGQNGRVGLPAAGFLRDAAAMRQTGKPA